MIRFLKAGERIPEGPPRRYEQRYVMLRWKVGTRQYVEVWEHRVRDGVVINGVVHHKDRDRKNNNPSNLEIHPDTKSHNKRHRTLDRETVCEMYRDGATTTAIAKHLGSFCGNISRIIREEGLEPRFGKGKPGNRRIEVDEDLVIRLLAKHRGNVLRAAKECTIAPHVIRRVQSEYGLPKPKKGAVAY